LQNTPATKSPAAAIAGAEVAADVVSATADLVANLTVAPAHKGKGRGAVLVRKVSVGRGPVDLAVKAVIGAAAVASVDVMIGAVEASAGVQKNGANFPRCLRLTLILFLRKKVSNRSRVRSN